MDNEPGRVRAAVAADEAGPSVERAAVDLFMTQAFHDHAARVQASSVRQTRDPEFAADVTQEAFLRLVIEVRAGRRPRYVGAWLHRTSANLIVSQARHEAVARRHAASLRSVDGPARPDSIALLREDGNELSLALEGVSSDERTGLLMAAHGATGAQIASSLGRSRGATRTMLSRARTRIRLACRDATGTTAYGYAIGAAASVQAPSI